MLKYHKINKNHLFRIVSATLIQILFPFLQIFKTH